MLVITGMFEDERFIPDTPISLPQKKKVTVTIEDNLDRDIKVKNVSTNQWREIGDAILNCDEELTGSPQPIHFKTLAEMETI